jgi:hypothetical protein
MTERGVPISEAARVLGVSVDAVRKRVQRRSVAAWKGADGRWRVILADADEGGTTRDAAVASGTIEGTAQVVTETPRRTVGLAAVQELIAPFIADLGAVREELGREKERRAAAERERDRLRLEVARLRSLHRREPQLAPDTRDGVG